MSLEDLKNIARQTELESETDSMSKGAIFWQRKPDRPALRIVADPRADTIADGRVEWTQAFLNAYEQVRRSVWQKLRKTEIAGTVFGPDEKEYRSVGDRTEAYLMWSTDAESNIAEEARKRVSEDAAIESIGKSIAIIRNGIPQAIEQDSSSGYLPMSGKFLDVNSVKTKFSEGVNGIFKRMYRGDVRMDDLTTNTLHDLHNFWQNDVGTATLQGEEIISLESRRNPKAWVVFVPPNHKLISHPHAFRVDTSHDLNLLYVRPVDMTPDWYGLVGVHELVHLHDFATGKESKNPSRDEYLDGEVRAFSAEVAAAQMITKNQFLRAIRERVNHLNLDPDKVTKMGLEQDAPWAESLVLATDRHLNFPKPAGYTEASTRAGFYLMALGFESIAMHAGSPESTPDQKRLFIEKIYQSQGVLPEK